ncbi:glycine--tRNA ligase subunit beta [candidate division WOR-3 bacterium]|nr:glycine--tRNA ligase subunit beta [candidate division WOR-3 bacterium]
MIDFLLEIGFEEFPTKFIQPAAKDMTERLEGLFKANKIFYRSVRTIYSSRRIGTIILGLPRKQKSQVVEIQGPPKKVAYDEEGKPTKMLEGFMRTHALKPEQLMVRKKKKGEYIYAKKEIAGASTEQLLEKSVPELIQNMEFPKTMIWPQSDIRFPRPIRWIIALLDRRPLRIKIAGVKADRYSMPNVHFSFNPIRLEKPREYLNFLRHGGVIADPAERKKLILKRLKIVSAKIDGKVIFTDDMIEDINCRSEYPEAVVGEFDEKYLTLPEELLMVVLRNQGDLIWIKPTNKFVCIFSAKKKAMTNVGKGYTHVISAKLYDAHFYYEQDLKIGLEKMYQQTRSMVWLHGLGSLYDKAQRLMHAVALFKGIEGLDIKEAQRAAQLCKADLLSNMVREKDFTSLQGIMGGYYAAIAQESENVVTAIKEHYLPDFAGDALPSTKIGAAVSIVDKIDHVTGAFLSGNVPSGSVDPLGMRRNAYSAIVVAGERAIHVSLYKIVESLLTLFNKEIDKHVIFGFVKERTARYLQTKKFRYDEINAVLEVWDGDVPDAEQRCLALKGLRNTPEFTKLVIGQKRVRNILKGIAGVGKVNPELFKEKAEKILYEQGLSTEERVKEFYCSRNYSDVLTLLLGMRADIDTFFDDVMVMCEDVVLQKNRLALVNQINKLFIQFADLSQIVIEGEKK